MSKFRYLGIINYAIICLLFFNCKDKRIIDDKILNNLAKQTLGHYKIDDTLYFKSSLGNTDTIKIVSIDTIIIKDPLYSINKQAEEKSITVKIQYLPVSKTYQGYLLNSNNKYDSIGNQDFIKIYGVIEDKTEYFVSIFYKGFQGDITLYSNNKTDTIKNLRKKKMSDISEIYWTKNIGLKGYRKSDGETYNFSD